jgi:F0F1-type ATP synthase epsilon subunit
MYISISSDQGIEIQPKCFSIKLALTSGQCEILPMHLPLVGSIDTGLVEMEIINNMNEKIKKSYLLQDAIVVVSNSNSIEEESSRVYVYARKMMEISKDLVIEDLLKNLQEKQSSLDLELNKMKVNSENENAITNSKIIILKNEITFLEKACFILKEKAKLNV